MADTSYMARKSVADIVKSAEGGERPLAKTLGALSITAMGIGAIIGAGIFVLTGTAAAQFAGPAIILSFILGGIACAFVGLCYSELAAMLPVCGSSYTYTYATLGEVFAWIIGWDLILEYAMGASTVAVGWSGYIVSLLHNVGIYHSTPAGGCARHHGEACRRDVGGGRRQSAGRLHHRDPDAHAGDGDQGIGTAQQRHGRDQAVCRGGVPRAGRVLRASRELASVHPGEHRRVRQLRHERNPARLRGRVLCVHRIRCGIDLCAGSEKTADATCRSAFSARWSSARSCTSRWRACSPDSCLMAN